MSEERKKITLVFLIDSLVSSEGLTGGTERQLVELIGRMNPNHFKVVLFCLKKYGEIPWWEKLNCEKHILNVNSFKSLKSILMFFYFVYFLKKSHVDIFQAHFFDSIFFGVFAARLAGVKHIISCRRDMGFWYTKQILRKLSWVNHLTDKIIVNSEAVKKNVLKWEKVPPEKIDIIYNGIDYEKIEKTAACNLFKQYEGIKAIDRVVGMVANFNRWVKRVDLFIMALEEVIKREKNVKFFIVGDGDLKEELNKLAKRLGVEDLVIWPGSTNNPIPFVKSFNIGVQSSDSEGFSNSILEYMAAGLPVVATDVGGNRELVSDGNSGYLVPANDHRALADKICQLLSNEILASDMGREGKRIVEEKYVWSIKIDEIEEYYHNIIECNQ